MAPLSAIPSCPPPAPRKRPFSADASCLDSTVLPVVKKLRLGPLMKDKCCATTPLAIVRWPCSSLSSPVPWGVVDRTRTSATQTKRIVRKKSKKSHRDKEKKKNNNGGNTVEDLWKSLNIDAILAKPLSPILEDSGNESEDNLWEQTDSINDLKHSFSSIWQFWDFEDAFNKEVHIHHKTHQSRTVSTNTERIPWRNVKQEVSRVPYWNTNALTWKRKKRAQPK
ncbi:hypothetical protein SK128_007136, partial [Halocaridina rubra]